jgi:hypothetical protein
MERIDEYVLEAGNAELGVKTRGGKAGVEIKGLVEIRSQLPGPFRGRIQIWSKWTSTALTINALPRVVVKKTRWLRKFDVTGSDVRELALDANERLLRPTDTLPQEGCNVELTRVTGVDNASRWWTFGLEAFGSLQTVEQNLRKTVGHLQRTSPPVLEGGVELSYPQWIDARQSPPQVS